MPAGLNGHSHISLPLPPEQRAAMLARVETALAEMTKALTFSGFSEYEASSINLATRFAITGMVKERARKS
jgi:hypothetical protein